jgi:hypothetical protein
LHIFFKYKNLNSQKFKIFEADRDIQINFLNVSFAFKNTHLSFNILKLK